MRLKVGMLGGVKDASSVVYRRSPRGSGPFRALSTFSDADPSKLIATTKGFSQFVLATNGSVNPRLNEMEGSKETLDGQSVRLTRQIASEMKNAGVRIQRGAGEVELSDAYPYPTQDPVDGGFTRIELGLLERGSS